MSTALKDRYDNGFYDDFSMVIAEIVPDFDKKKFKNAIFSPAWNGMELKDRMRHSASVLGTFLPNDFLKSSFLIKKIVKTLIEKEITDRSLEYMLLPEFIEQNGMNYPNESISVFEEITGFTSCEFAIRPYIIKYPDLLLKRILSWTKSKDLHVRRLASEGCRPRLPWAVSLPEFKNDPSDILPVLTRLMYDESEYVRRSVANNLNDISKDNPIQFLKFVNKWKGTNTNIDGILKHASRTLLKAGNKDILKLFELTSKNLKLKKFEVETYKVKVPDYLVFSVEVANMANAKQLRIEYAIYFLLKNGSWSKKVFKISENEIGTKTSRSIVKKHSFRVITTRKFYKGQHFVSIILNGSESPKLPFELNL